MRTKLDLGNSNLDPAAVFAAAISLWEECHKQAAIEPRINLSDCYSGIDGLMRETMRIATLFEAWSCKHVNFDELNDVWPYLLEDRFGQECLSVLLLDGLSVFDESDCRRVAARCPSNHPSATPTSGTGNRAIELPTSPQPTEGTAKLQPSHEASAVAL